MSSASAKAGSAKAGSAKAGSAKAGSTEAGSTEAGSTEAGSPGLRVGEAAGRWVLLATVLGSGMAMLDATVVNVALPRSAATSTRSGGPAVDVNGYTLTLAALILLGGSLGDRFGRRRVFIVGVGLVRARVGCCAALAPAIGC